MHITHQEDFCSHVERMRAHVRSGATSPWLVRQRTLRKLHSAIRQHEQELLQALHADLGKSNEEVFLTELFTVYSELKHAIKHLRAWSKPRKLATDIAHLRTSAVSVARPKGVVLIVSPWNYPLSLTLIPLISALAAGNSVILKMSSKTPATSRAVARLIEQTFDPLDVLMLRSSSKVYPWLEHVAFDHIFFTGSARIGREYYRIASKHLTPVTLELGGKCPALVMAGADLTLAARRIAWGKLLNAGQTCVAPDYLLVDASIAAPFIAALKVQIQQMYGDDPLTNPQYPHLISHEALQRVQRLTNLYTKPQTTPQISPCLASREGRLELGGRCCESTLRMEPTIISGVKRSSLLMSEEIFGPVIPILLYDNIDRALDIISDHPTPLACYIFAPKATSAEVDELFALIPAGATVVNDTVINAAQTGIPFGGVGTSGIGAYHGKRGFDEMSHQQPLIIRRAWPDLRLRYAPFNPSLISWLKKLC